MCVMCVMVMCECVWFAWMCAGVMCKCNVCEGEV